MFCGNLKSDCAKKGNERMHTAIMPLVFITHIAAVVVAVTDPRRGDAPAVIAAELICVAGSDQSGCRDKTNASDTSQHNNKCNSAVVKCTIFQQIYILCKCLFVCFFLISLFVIANYLRYFPHSFSTNSEGTIQH